VSGLADDEQDEQDAEAREPEGGQGEPTDEQQAMADSLEQMMESIRQAKVGQLLVSTISTFASVAYGKLELEDLPEAKAAIDAIGALVPLLEGQVDDGIRRDFGQALTNLKLAYADAVASAE
jgi:hypothetical protein